MLKISERGCPIFSFRLGRTGYGGLLAVDFPLVTLFIEFNLPFRLLLHRINELVQLFQLNFVIALLVLQLLLCFLQLNVRFRFLLPLVEE